MRQITLLLFLLMVLAAAAPVGAIPAPTAWYDAGDITGLGDMDYVNTWPDKSGNGLDLTTVNQAYYCSIRYDTGVSSLNNQPAVHWVGSGNHPPATGSANHVYMKHAADSHLAGTAYTVFMVGDFTSIATAASVVSVIDNRTTDDTVSEAAYLGYTGQWAWHISGYGNYRGTSTSGGSVCILEGLYGNEPNNLAVYRDGVAGSSPSGGGSPTNYSNINRGIFLGKGDYYSTSWTYPTMDLAEVIIYNRKLTDAERNEVGAYLQAKYAISGSYGVPEVVIPRPTAWYDASYITGLADTDYVNTWPDKSGNGLDLTTVNQAYYCSIRYDTGVSSLNNQPAVHWVGSGNHPPATGSANHVYMYQDASADLRGNSYTIFAAGDFTSIATAASVVSVIDNRTTDDTVSEAAYLGYTGQYAWHISGYGNYRGASTSGGSVCILEGFYGNEPNNLAVYRNGVAGSSPSGGGSPTNYRNMDRGIFLGKGDYYSTSWTYPTMDLAEVIIYNRKLTDAERNIVGSYLQNKYDLSGSYKTPPASEDTVFVNGTTAYFETAQLQAKMVDGQFTYLRNKLTDTVYITGGIDSGSAVKTATLYASHGGGNTVNDYPARQDITYNVNNVYNFGTATSIALTTPYEVIWTFSNSSISSQIRVWIDQVTHELCVQQRSSGPYTDVHRVRWALTNINNDLDVIIPTDGGIRLADNDTEATNIYFMWPWYWNSQFVVLHNGTEGFCVYGSDTADRFKGLKLDRTRTNNALGFDTEADTPFSGTTTMNSVIWRISTYKGSWSLPVHQYREWMAHNFTIAGRPSWIKDLTMASFNCPSSMTVPYDQMSNYVDTNNVLVGATSWRYYQDYAGTAGGWLNRAPEYSTIGTNWNNEHEHWVNDHGFKTMIWINPWQCRNDDANTGYNVYSTFSPSAHIQNPMNNTEYWPLATELSKTAYINITSDAWREAIIDTQLSAGWADMTIKPKTIFLDTSWAISQDASGYLDGWTNMCEGYQQFESKLLSTFPGVALAGENLSDVTFRQEAIAHIHGYGSTSINSRFVIPTAAHARLCPVFTVLYSPYTKLYGFWGLDGMDANSTQCNEAYKILRFEPAVHPLPTYNGNWVFLSANGGTTMNAVVQEMVDRANGSNSPPTLTSCSVSPSSGSTTTTFSFSCDYTDADNDGPGQSASPDSYVHVVIDNIVYDMGRIDSLPYTSAVTFSLSKSHFGSGTHYYHFECWDSWKVVRYPTSGESSFTVN